jgi:O-antigen/teichoic acid export membrane protein
MRSGELAVNKPLSAKLSKTKENLALALGAQLIVLGTGIVKSLLLPHVMSVESFAYWQQYVLYSGFVGIFALGFNDGVYLLYGGSSYDDLPFKKLRTAFRFYCGMLLLFAGAIALYALAQDAGRGFGFFFVALDTFILCVSGLMTYVLQITDQFKWYALCTVIDKFVFLGAAATMSLLGVADHRMYVVADFISKIVSFFIFVWRCRRLVFGSAAGVKEGWQEFSGDIKIGINLMFANFAGMLVANLGRFIVEWFGGLDGYAYYSFGTSVTNLVLTLVTAVSSVLYPALKRLPDDAYGSYYERIDRVVFWLACAGLAVYFPAYLGVEAFYAKYTPMLAYLNLLFVAAVYQSKMSVLVNTFYNALRKEHRLLIVNLQSVVCFCIIAFISYSFTRDIWWIAASTAIVGAGRCLLSEIELRRELGIEGAMGMIAPLALALSFFFATQFCAFSVSAVAYVVSAAVLAGFYMVINERKKSSCVR